MPGSTPPTSQLDWLISMTAMIVLFWSRATRDLLKSFGWGIGALHRLDAATKLPFPRRPPHSISLRGIALAYLFPEKRFPDGVMDHNLRSFLNAILHCHSASEVCKTLNEAIETAEKKAGCPLKELSMYDFPSWA